jgi:hypothetical protein
MKVVSKIDDGRIGAKNVLIEMSIDEYLPVGRDILKKNEFQRNRVKRSSTVYSLFRKDLKKGCTFPPIVLALSASSLNGKEPNTSDINDDYIKQLFHPDNLLILDGLQRTYNLIDVYDEYFKSDDADSLNEYKKRNIRIEIYVGINKIGILYRMLTLNTGQTPMSARHQIEILYSDYIDIGIGDIKFYRQIDEKRVVRIGEYQLKDVIEGFNSYLDRDESGIDRGDILDNIENLEKLSEENAEKDIFKEYIETYDSFMKRMEIITSSWTYKSSDEMMLNSVFGKDIVHIFNKPQSLSAFGAAIGKLKDNGIISSFEDIPIKDITISNIDKTMNSLLNNFDAIKKNARKIGVEQRAYLRLFFTYLFSSSSESYLSIDKTVTESYKRYTSLL